MQPNYPLAVSLSLVGSTQSNMPVSSDKQVNGWCESSHQQIQHPALEQQLAAYYPLVTIATDAKSLHDHTVNAVISDGAGDLAADEISRLISSGGVTVINGTAAQAATNPGYDGWTHWLGDQYGSGANQDTEVGPSTSLRWWDNQARSQHFRASDGVVVYAEKQNNIDFINHKSPKVSDLFAVDVFSGVPLWRLDNEIVASGDMNRHGFVVWRNRILLSPYKKRSPQDHTTTSGTA